MRVVVIAIVLAASVGVGAAARADVIGTCPPGQMWRGNDVPPGAMHHSGGQCVPDPSATTTAASPPAEAQPTGGSGCTASGRGARGDIALAAAMALTGVIAIARRRRGLRPAGH